MKIQNEIDRDAPLTNVEKAALGLFALWPLLAIIAIGALFSGCSSTPTGVRVVASSATATNLGDINWDEYKIPVFSVYTGPKTTIWVNRDYLALKSVTAGGCVTNDTSALGVYSSREQKQTRVELEFDTIATNAPCPVAAAQAAAPSAACSDCSCSHGGACTDCQVK